MLVKEVSNKEKIYRYTTIETAFSTIDHKSLRLNGLMGMNDKSEVGYVDTYLDNTFIPFKNTENIKKLNNRFILCSSSLSDDLMQWRLYGDDCKGACLVFSITPNKDISGLNLRKISYGILKNDKNFHPELELIAEIINSVKTNAKEAFQFRSLPIWKHFFKPYEYALEKEIRLLVTLSTDDNNSNEDHHIKGQLNTEPIVSNKQWCLTSSHKILNPFITISLENKDIQLKLEKIILGSKCPEILINQAQFKQFLGEKNMNNINVEISKINNYR